MFLVDFFILLNEEALMKTGRKIRKGKKNLQIFSQMLYDILIVDQS